MNVILRVLLIWTSATFLSSCADPGLPEASYLEARIVGAFNFRHLAWAESGAEGRIGNRTYTVTSSHQDNTIEVQLLRFQQDWFREGTFSLSPRSADRGDNEGETIRVRHGDDIYVAESGTLQVTRVDGGWVSGTFEFVGAWICNPEWHRESCFVFPDSFHAATPRIQVRGSFHAEPSRPVPALDG